MRVVRFSELVPRPPSSSFLLPPPCQLLNCQLAIGVGLAGPQPARFEALWASPDLNRRDSERSGPRRTSTPRKKNPERMPERISDRTPDRMSNRLLDGMPAGMPDRMPDRMSERMPDRMPDRMSERMPDKNVGKNVR